MKGRSKAAVLVVLALLLVALAFRVSRQTVPRVHVTEIRDVALEQEGVEGVDAGAPLPRPVLTSPKPTVPSGEVCVKGASQRCFQGDVWSVDSCDGLEEKLDECGARLCRDGACEAVDIKPCREPAHGRCDGDTVRMCLAGRSRSLNCASLGMRCAMGPEGAECLPRIAPAERCAGPTRCEGDVLVGCEAGATVRTDCRRENARCLTLADALGPACVSLAPREPSPCGPCGCASTNAGEETACDGKDDDGDGLVDEALDCGPLPIIAFLITDTSGQTSHAPSDVEEEIARVNQLFASSEVSPAPQAELREIIEIRDASLLEIDGSEVARLATDPRVHPERAEFYVPLVFTDVVLAGGATPRLGISTLPNGTCGGVQRGVGPEVGVIVVAKQRAPTTVVHELGHFLGLCHTHEDPALVRRVAVEETGQVKGCGVSCRGEGDGMCDTPRDPGPESCPYDATCATSCRDGSSPDPTNVMSYYTECRRIFSEEQVLTMEHTMALRRGWHRCAGQACVCQPGTASCPANMSCRSFSSPNGEIAFRCALDGPLGPGSLCERPELCGRDSQCTAIQSSGVKRCVRTCLASSPSCTCIAASESLRLCAEDVAPSHGG